MSGISVGDAASGAVTSGWVLPDIDLVAAMSSSGEGGIPNHATSREMDAPRVHARTLETVPGSSPAHPLNCRKQLNNRTHGVNKPRWAVSQGRARTSCTGTQEPFIDACFSVAVAKASIEPAR